MTVVVRTRAMIITAVKPTMEQYLEVQGSYKQAMAVAINHL